MADVSTTNNKKERKHFDASQIVRKAEDTTSDRSKRYLRWLCEKGMERLIYPKIQDKENFEELKEEYVGRYEYELEVIEGMGYVDYFLIVQDYVNYAKKNGMPTGPGRGCLTPDSMVWTEHGIKKLSEIIIGDKVFDEEGKLVTVLQTFQYDIEEEVIEILPYFGEKITLTADHKVLHESVEFTPENEYKNSGKRYKINNLGNNLEWSPASELNINDFLVIPRPKLNKILPKSIDLKGFIPENIINRVKVFDDTIVHNRTINYEYKASKRDINRNSGISRDSINSILLDNGLAKEETVNRLTEFLQNEYDFSLFEWKEYIKNIKSSRDIELKRNITIDSSFMYLLGYYIADGWTHDRRVGFAFHENDKDKIEKIKRAITDVFGITEIIEVKPIPNKKLISLFIYSDILVNVFKYFVPEKCLDKRIPPEMFSYSLPLLEKLIEGLWDGDGHISHHSVRYSTISRGLAEDVKFVLLCLGVPSKIKIRHHKDKESWHDSYTVQASTNPIFEKLFDKKMHTRYVWQSDDENIYVKVRDIKRSFYKGSVCDLMVDTKAEPSYLTEGFLVHNSAAGSLVSYLTGITSVDPIPYGLYFERFLNPGRKGMPDIDIDFPQSKRQEIIAHIRALYGNERVAQIATFSYMAARGAVRDSARILGFPAEFGDKISKMISDKPKTKIQDDLVEGTELHTFYHQNPDVKNVVDTAMRIEGLIRQGSIHASALVIAPVDITDKMPLQTPKKSQIAKTEDGSTDMSSLLVQFDGPTVESLGYLKMDILGLGTLDVIEDTLEFIKKTRGINLTLEEIPFDDKKTYELLSAGDTNGVFQVESSGMKDILKLIKPKRFEEIGDIIALYRPGPMEYIPAYKAGKDNPEKIKYLVPELKPILEDTYGVACIAENSLVATKNGYKKIQDISIGEKVLTEDGTYQNCIAVLDKGFKETIKIRTDFGEELICTPDHKVLTQLGWVEAGQLIRGSKIKTFINNAEKYSTVLEINEGKKEHVYDLSVETTHSFVVGGLVVHNCYQEQLMEVAKEIGGFTLAEADDLRKAISKKKADLLAKLEEKFYEGCRAKGIVEKKIPELWKLMEAASGYSFNKSHAFCYAVISYQTAYLKANYPTEFMASLMTYKKDDQDSIKDYINDCKRMGLKVVPPHVNYSSIDFDITPNGDIIFGLAALKGVGFGPAIDIIDSREDSGHYKDLNDFLSRVKINSRVFEILAKSSALDNLGWTKKALIAEKDRIIDFIKTINKKQDFGLQQGFDFFDEVETVQINPRINTEFDEDVLLEFENEMLGMYLTGHPIEYYELSRRLKTKGLPESQTYNVAELPKLKNKDEIYTFGIVSRIHRFESKKGWMAFVTISDFGKGKHSYFGLDPKMTSFDMVLFTDAYNNWGYKMNENDFLFVQGTMNERKDTGALSLIANNITFLTKDKELNYQSDAIMRKIVLDVMDDIEKEKTQLLDGTYEEVEDVVIPQILDGDIEEYVLNENKENKNIVTFVVNDNNSIPLLKIIKKNPGDRPYVIKLNGEILEIDAAMNFPTGISLTNKVKMALDFAEIKIIEG